MNVVVNGKPEEVAGKPALGEFLHNSLGGVDGIIVELNGEFINKDDLDRHTLQEGDRIELIQFIGGG